MHNKCTHHIVNTQPPFFFMEYDNSIALLDPNMHKLSNSFVGVSSASFSVYATLSNRCLPNTECGQLRKLQQQIMLAKKFPLSIILTCSCSAFTITDCKCTLLLKLFSNCQFSYSLLPSKISCPLKIPASGGSSEFLQLITCQCKWKRHSCCLVIQKFKVSLSYKYQDYSIQMWYGHGNKWGYIPPWQQFPKLHTARKRHKEL